jgi:ELWxxDGT repeat protein
MFPHSFSTRLTRRPCICWKLRPLMALLLAAMALPVVARAQEGQPAPLAAGPASLVADLNPAAAAGSSPYRLAVVGSKLFFQTNDGQYASDGTTAGTIKVSDFSVGDEARVEGPFGLPNGEALLVKINEEAYTLALWITNGSAGNLRLVKEFTNAVRGEFALMGNHLYFVVARPTSDRLASEQPALWRSDGTSAGTVLVKQFQGTSGLYGAQYPAMLTPANGQLFFIMNQLGQSGLWKSNGTETGTVFLATLNSCGSCAGPNVTEMVNDNGKVFFVLAEAARRKLYISDGIAAGTYPLLATPTQSIGAGTFATPVNIPGSGRGTDALALGDLNGDGALDVVIGNSGYFEGGVHHPQASQIALGNGAGGFATLTDIPGSERGTWSVNLGDLNGDRKLDLLLGNRWQPSQIALGNGAGGFATLTDIPGSGHDTMSSALGDLNRDGALDLVLGNYGKPSQIALGTGRGSFGSLSDIPGSGRETDTMALGDLNRDGALDLVLGNIRQASQVALGTGAGNFGPLSDIPGSGRETQSVALGDLNRDGALDVILGNYYETSQVALGNGKGGFMSATDIAGSGPGTNALALGDLNGDGALDLLLGNANQLSPYADQFNQVAFGDGKGGFGLPIDIPASGPHTWAVAMGDLNNDGALDLLLGNYANPSQVALSSRAINFAVPADIPNSRGGTQSVALGDLNGDGVLDIALGHYYEPGQIALGNPRGGFSPAIDIPGSDGRFTISVALGDLNNDGALDVVLGNYYELSQVALGDGAGGFGVATDILGTARFTHAIALGDLNRDGALDLVLGNDSQVSDGPPSQVALGDGAGGFRPPTDIPGTGGRHTEGIALGDLNQDGVLDLVLGNWEQSQVALGDGAGGFRPPTDIPGTGGRITWSPALGDLNGDGLLDLVLGNEGYASQVLLGNGNGGFGTPTDIPGSGRKTRSAALGDVNKDGALDIVLGNHEPSQLVLGDGKGGFTASTDIAGTGGRRTWSVALGDQNNDGLLDLVIGNDMLSQVVLGLRPALEQTLAVNDRAFFVFDDGSHGRELWASKGTLGGTAIVKDLTSGVAGSDIQLLAALGRFAYFTLRLPDGGLYLYRSDGTGAGTVQVSPTPFVSIGEAVAVGSTTLLFAGESGGSGSELWATDGTVAGTRLVQDIYPGAEGSGPAEFTRVGDHVFFGADDGQRGDELWKVAVTALPQRPTKTLQFKAAADTYVDQVRPTTHYAGSTELLALGTVNQVKRGYLRFTVGAIPSGATVVRARVRLTVINDSTSGGLFYQTQQADWPEAITWNSKPATYETVTAVYGPVVLGQVVELDVTRHITGNGRYGYMVKLPSGNGNHVGYASREHKTGSAVPVLEVTYSQ